MGTTQDSRFWPTPTAPLGIGHETDFTGELPNFKLSEGAESAALSFSPRCSDGMRCTRTQHVLMFPNSGEVF